MALILLALQALQHRQLDHVPRRHGFLAQILDRLPAEAVRQLGLDRQTDDSHRVPIVLGDYGRDTLDERLDRVELGAEAVVQELLDQLVGVQLGLVDPLVDLERVVLQGRQDRPPDEAEEVLKVLGDREIKDGREQLGLLLLDQLLQEVCLETEFFLSLEFYCY